MIGELRQEKILVRYFRASSPLMHKYVLNIPITIVQQIMSEYAQRIQTPLLHQPINGMYINQFLIILSTGNKRIAVIFKVRSF